MTTCDIDIRFFPFDDQACPIQVSSNTVSARFHQHHECMGTTRADKTSLFFQIGAWAYYSARMNLTNSSSEVITHDFKLNGEWDIYHTKAEWLETILPCCPNTRFRSVGLL